MPLSRVETDFGSTIRSCQEKIDQELSSEKVDGALLRNLVVAQGIAIDKLRSLWLDYPDHQYQHSLRYLLDVIDGAGLDPDKRSHEPIIRAATSIRHSYDLGAK